MKLIGRDREVELLSQMHHSDMPEFMALYGRRRVGKTFLIRSFFKERVDSVFLNVTGSRNAPMFEQIQHFTDQMSEAFHSGVSLKVGNNWDEVLAQLTQTIRHQVAQEKKVVLFFDELPWMVSPRSRLLEMIDYYWNQHWSEDPRIRLIVCGSSASWIINRVIQDKGGLHNRVTRSMHLEPFNLVQMKHFLHSTNKPLNDQQVLQLYTLTGGVPFYLTKIEKGLSASQVIEQQAFSRHGFFLDEFDKLFSSLFDNAEAYIALVRLLSEHRSGLSQQLILEKMGKQMMGGRGLKMLDDLEKTGFIMRFLPLYSHKRGIYYRLMDEYTLFYLKWIEPIRHGLAQQSLESHYWSDLQTTAQWHSWQGYAFESICYKHLPAIRKALHLGPRAIPGTWRFVPSKGSDVRGAQIDLLFDRPDDAITLCEIKSTTEPFVLTKDYIQDLERKITVFKEQTKTKKQVFIVLITTNGVRNHYYADNVLDRVISLDDLYKVN